jgi:hypothetical protein
MRRSSQNKQGKQLAPHVRTPISISRYAVVLICVKSLAMKMAGSHRAGSMDMTDMRKQGMTLHQDEAAI